MNDIRKIIDMLESFEQDDRAKTNEAAPISGPDGLEKISLVNGEYGFSQVTAAIEDVVENLYRAGVPAHYIEKLMSDALNFLDVHLDNIIGDLDPKHEGGTQSTVFRR